MSSIRFLSQRTLPEPLLTARCKRSPELGPRLLFFSGGSALKALSSSLTAYTHNSIHCITPFDSGGSSAVLRQAFRMPAVGDIRNRLMALADQSLLGNPEIVALFASRLPKDADADALRRELANLAHGRHPLVAAIPNPMRKIIRTSFYALREQLPPSFDLRGASLGNLVLASGYLSNRRHLDPVIYLFSMLVRVLGVVRPILNRDLHLAARLSDGRVLVGQHLLTGKETPPLTAAIESIWLTQRLDTTTPAAASIRPKTARLIDSADCISYPMGSFFTSLIATLLPRGVGLAVSRAACPKVFIPNTGNDPELLDYDLDRQVETLLGVLRRDNPETIEPAAVLSVILVDKRSAAPLDRERWARLGIQVLECDLVSERSAPYLDAEKLAQVLVSLS